MANDDAPVELDARGMKCPWPALRAARAMRERTAVMLVADDPMASSEIAALASAQGWTLRQVAVDRMLLTR